MTEAQIFTVGGTVQASNGLYIARRADDELLALCHGGNFGYVLTPRQLGKSSLMVRTAEQLTAEGTRSVIIDLSQIGVQVSPEEWYLGLLSMIEEQLDLDTNAVNWWRERGHLGVTQRLTMFFEEVLLKEVDAPVVVFVDEIDTTLSLNFTDDFFAAIRYFYNARAVSKDVRRLSFVLIGVATPGDLIRDPQRTPFNIGQRVDLTDFTLEEALPFAAGFGLADREARRVLGWVLKWTGGHPYLTQRLCRALTDGGRTNWSEEDVDEVVSKTFFGKISEEDNNLQFVRDMLTKRAPDLSEVLYTYREVLNHKHPVQDEEQSLVKSHLKLSGVAQRRHGELSVRNPIYARVFNDAWVKHHLPVNWFKRARRAGIPLAFALLLFAAAVAGFSAVKSRRDLQALTIQKEQADARFEETVAENEVAKQRSAEANLKLKEAELARFEASARLTETETRRRQAEEASNVAKQKRALAETQRQQTLIQLQLAEAAKREAEKLREAAEETSKQVGQQRDFAQGQHQVSVARQLADQGGQLLLSGNVPAARLFLSRALTLDDRPATRRSLLEAQAKRAQEVWVRPMLANNEGIDAGHTYKTFDFSPDGQSLALANNDPKAIELLNAKTKEGSILDQSAGFTNPVFSSDGKQVAARKDATMRVWDADTGRFLEELTIDNADLIAFYPDTKRVAQDAKNAGVVVVDTNTRARLPLPVVYFYRTFSSDRRRIAIGTDNGQIRILNVETAEDVYELNGPKSRISDLAFSPNGKRLASASDNEITLWDLSTGKQIRTMDFNRALVHLVFSPDDTRLAAMGDDGLRIWNAETGQEVRTLALNNLNDVRKIVLGPEGEVATQHADGTIRIWDSASGEVSTALNSNGPVLKFSRDGALLYSLNNRKMTTWDVRFARAGKLLIGHNGAIRSVAFSADGRLLASGGRDKTIKVWNVETGRAVENFAGEKYIHTIRYFDSQRERLGSLEWGPVTKDIVYKVRDAKTGKEITTIPLMTDLPSDFFPLSPDGRSLMVREKPDAPIRIRNLETGKEFAITPLGSGEISLDLLSFSPDSRQFAQGDFDGTIKISDTDTGRENRVLHGQKMLIALFFSSDNRKLASVSESSIEIWDTGTKRVISTISKLTGALKAGVFSPDGHLFAAVVSNRRIKLWDVETGSLVRTLSAETPTVGFVFSPDGQWLVSHGSEELRLWNLATKNPDTGFILPGFGGGKAAFTPDGRRLAYGGTDGQVRLWEFEAVKRIADKENHWTLLREIQSEESRRVTGFDFEYVSQVQLREILGDKYDPSFETTPLDGTAEIALKTRQDDEKDKQAELTENELKKHPPQRGTITGTISFDGEPPEPKRIDSSADPVCTIANPNLTTEDWIVNDGKLANVFVYVKSEGRLENYFFETPTSEVVLEQKNCRSMPHLLGIQVHQVLKLLNSDPTMHNYRIIPKNNPSWNRTLPKGGAPFYHEFDRPETFIPVKDNQHPWEKSYIGVFSNPFFAVSAKDGSYTITGLPPGRYTIVAWHEGGATGSEQTFEVTIGPGESKTINFTFSKP